MLDNIVKLSRTKYMLLFSAFALILFLVVVLSSYGIHRRSVELVLEESRSEDLTLARASVTMLERSLSSMFGQLEYLGQLPEIQSGQNLEGSAAFSSAYELWEDHWTSLCMINEHGDLLAGIAGKDRFPEKDFCDRYRDVISKSLEKKKKRVSEVQSGQNGKNIIFLSSPVYQKIGDGESQYRGILLVGLNPDRLIRTIATSTGKKREVHFVIIHRSGEVIASSENSGMAGNNVFDSRGNCVECHRDISALGDVVASAGGSDVIDGHFEGGELVTYTSMGRGYPEWLVGVHSDYGNVMGSFKAIYWYSILIVLVGVIVLLPGTYLLFMFGKKREEAEEKAKYLEKEKKLLEKLREADREISGHNRELSALHELASEVNRTLVLQEVLHISLEKTIELTSFENGAIYIPEDDGNSLSIREHQGLSDKILKELEHIRMGQSLTGRVAEIGKPVFIESMASDPRCEIPILKEEEFQSYAGIPLMHGSRLVGVLGLGARKNIKIDSRKQEWLKGIGTIIGMAIGNCMLYHEVRVKAEEMSILYDVGRDLTSTIELSKLGKTVIDTLSGRLEYPACTLLLPDRQTKEMYVQETSYTMDKNFSERRFSVGKDGVTGWVALTKESLYVPDVSAEKRYIEGRPETRAELSIPLVFGDELMGVLDFEKDAKNSFSEDEIRFLTLFANQLSVALYNVNMFEETVRMNRELNRVSELKSEFVSLVSHELRTPLTAIKSSIDIILLKMNENLEPNVSYFLSMAKANVDRLSNMIDNILDISRIESGRMQFSFDSMDIKEPASKVLRNITPLAIQKGLQLQDEILGDLPAVRADGSKVEQVFTNLIGNAIKFTPKGGSITVRASRKNVEELGDRIERKIRNGHRTFVQVTIQDSGPGIPETEHEEIFKRYRRIEKGTGKGTGLGLAISKYLVESHGGGIWVESETGKGASFNFLIPVFEEGSSSN